jgi:hypothetical protein
MQMTPRQLREQIDAIDLELGELQPWEKKLTAMRKNYVLNDERNVVNIIENGLRGGQGRPAYTDLDPFDDGWPGLLETRDTIATLKERRALLVEQQPSKAQTAERAREADALAAEIQTRARALGVSTERAHAAVNEAARLCLAVAEETWRLCEANASLDKLATDADIVRPETLHPDAPMFPLAASASMLLSAFFHGGQPGRVDSSLVPDIRVTLAEHNQQGDVVPVTPVLAERG